jgi:hypothetical protein
VEMLAVVRCILLCMLKAVEGVRYVLEPLKMMRGVLELLELMRHVRAEVMLAVGAGGSERRAECAMLEVMRCLL